MLTLSALIGSLFLATTISAAQRAVPSHESPRTTTPAPAAPAAHAVARVNDAVIMSDRLDAAVAALIPMESFHRNVSDEKRAALKRQALDGLIADELEFQEGQRLGIRVADSDIESAWREMAARYGGERGFAELLRRNGASAQQARGEIVRMLTIRTVLSRAVTATCSVTQDEAARFYEQHPERFVEPEQLHIQAVTVGVDPSSGAAQWSAARERAGEALRHLRDGVPFDRIVAEYSTDGSKASGGDLGFVHRGSLTEQFEAAARQLAVGQPSEVIETLYGYHIIRVLDVRPAQRKSFADVRAALQKDLTATRCDERKTAWVAGLRARSHVTVLEQP